MDAKTTPSLDSCDLFLFAGEASGDLHGEALIQSLKSINPSLKIAGVGGPKMRKAGLFCILPMEEFQVMGFVDVFLALPRLTRHFYFLRKKILTLRPSLALFIDYPGFAMRMEKHLKKKKFAGKIIHYICPSVWAWGKKRVPAMEKNLDLLLSIFPFEKRFFSPSFPIHYVGHPLTSRIARHEEKPLLLPKEKKILSLFPGSRHKEIVQNFPLQLQVYKALLQEDPELYCAISLSNDAFLPLLTCHIEKEGLILGKNVAFIPIENTYDLMKRSLFAIAKSGTVTLELALFQVPTLVMYAISPMDLFIAKTILRIRLPFYCIVNIIASQEVYPEFIGPYATKEAILLKAKKLLQDAQYREEKKALCQKVRSILGEYDASKNAARIIADLFS
jgi:lipid-A-disaccharide synthase